VCRRVPKNEVLHPVLRKAEASVTENGWRTAEGGLDGGEGVNASRMAATVC
jgi:hypothetical protein